MQLQLIRAKSSTESTIGQLYLDGRFECYTLEDVIRPDGVKVFGKTCIPAGKYKIQLTLSSRFNRVLPLLLNVPNFGGIRIHPGNWAKDTEGCILVGWGVGTDEIYQSRDAFAALFAKLRAAEIRGEGIEITITNPT